MFTQVNHKGRRQAIRTDTYSMRERSESVQVWASHDCSLFQFSLDEWRKLKANSVLRCIAKPKQKRINFDTQQKIT